MTGWLLERSIVGGRCVLPAANSATHSDVEPYQALMVMMSIW